ncbi:hypothetical protein A1O1_03772 [Capronia coronata CBS 617.96]|uniref:Lysine-specific metallo-endopeptidase domain-containing protein n=1 Tax=Capronia coronata CBS 617.96 TaxID=1182541 RepID=W9YDQ0_9EURO|nr:uncharacterized protein A1O1_03772 [Capronia coronata CBS 617.96]EXJ90668.1 hypothetical protein A1O1_03772 [Capronia coronata CBS 617.96]
MGSLSLSQSLFFLLVFFLGSNLCNASLPEFSIAEDVTLEQADQKLQESFMDALILARVTATTFSACDASFLRYFRALEATFVQDVFETIANFPLDHQIDEETVIEILSSASVASELQPKFAKLEIAIGNHPALPEEKNLCGTQSEGGTVFAFTYLDPSALGDVALISLCEETFQYPSLQEIENPPDHVRDAEGRPLPGYTCDGLGDHDTDWMSSPGGVLLHELLHWIYLLEDIPNYHDLIEMNEMGDHQIGDFDGPNPSDGS